MKRSSIVCQVAMPALMLVLIGCQGPSDTAQTDSAAAGQDTATQTTDETASSETVPGDGEGVTLVSLKVPNMH
jgi:hypothetical protein